MKAPQTAGVIIPTLNVALFIETITFDDLDALGSVKAGVKK